MLRIKNSQGHHEGKQSYRLPSINIHHKAKLIKTVKWYKSGQKNMKVQKMCDKDTTVIQ